MKTDTATCLETVDGSKQGMLPVRYFRSNKSSFLCKSDFIVIISLPQRRGKSGRPQFFGDSRI